MRTCTMRYLTTRAVTSVCVLLLGVIYLSSDVTCQTVAEAKALRTKLFVTDGYDVKVRPANNQSLATGVMVVLTLLAINNLVAVSETFITTASLTVTWTDEQLVWTPATYGGISSYRWPQNDVWKPPMALANSVSAYKQLGDPSLHILVTNAGTVEWKALNVFQSTCMMNIRFYPFDVQTCELQFVAWGYSRAQVDMLSTGGGFDFEEYQSSPVWDLIDHSWWIAGDADDVAITFAIKVRRKPMFVLMTTIAPIFLIGILNLFVFMTPCEEGEKAGYAVTVLLSSAIFHTIVANTLPDHSDSASILSVYLTLQTVQSAIITMIALTMLRCSSFGEETKIPKPLLWMIDLIRMKQCRGRSNKNNIVDCAETKNEKILDSKDSEKEMKKIEYQSATAWSKSYTWKEAMNALDAVLFVVFFIIFAVSTITCVCLAATSD